MLQKLRQLVWAIKDGQRDLYRLRRDQEILLWSVLRSEYRSLIESDKFSDTKRLNAFGYALYSQADEDGILAEIFKRIGVGPRTFVEFGCGNGLENNTHALILDGWRGLWMDANESQIASAERQFADVVAQDRLHIRLALLDPHNINGLIGEYFEGEIDLLSVDIDGNDFHVLKEISCINPRVIVVEYNARKGPTIDWVIAYNAAHRWDGTDYFGASLKAYEHLLKERGYLLVGCSISGVNAFFVREDLATPELFCGPFTSENHFEPQRKLLRRGIHTTHPRNYGPWDTARRLLEDQK
ncbi:FkbM family methyltransferase [Pelagibius litoralis]|uniref:FkbM family methyltransferase n=1 Tax=Pelagibius litoralis TaxID=374515 RepID=A0A967C261_9PROT|nr:FkbM family methyltransferase [Pelagibius litoralis]NIA67898.1 FkbM family methyltransferase [Pelagibius litoralis]